VLQGLWWLPTAEDAAARSGGAAASVLPGGEGGAELLRLVRGSFNVVFHAVSMSPRCPGVFCNVLMSSRHARKRCCSSAHNSCRHRGKCSKLLSIATERQ